MAIKAGDLVATVPGSSSTMISDGKRMRVLWKNDHRDGDSTQSLVARSKTTVRGHPTWKALLRVKKEAEQAHAKKVQDSVRISLSGAIPVTSSPLPEERNIDPRGHPIGNADHIYPGRPAWKQEDSISNGHIKFERFSLPRHYEPGPIDSNLKPLGITDKAIEDSPYFDVLAVTVRKRSRHMPGDMAAAYEGLNSKRNAKEAGIETTTKQKRTKAEQ